MATIMLLAPALVSCKHYVKTVEPQGAPAAIEPYGEACADKDVKGFVDSHMIDIEECTKSLSCKKHPRTTLTLMVGCNDALGGATILTPKELSSINDCVSEKADLWDYSSICGTPDSECGWGVNIDIVCKLE